MKYLLLIEDCPFLVLLAKKVLSTSSFHLLVAENLSQAKARLERHKAEIAWVIADLHLPDAERDDVLEFIQNTSLDTIIMSASAELPGSLPDNVHQVFSNKTLDEYLAVSLELTKPKLLSISS